MAKRYLYNKIAHARVVGGDLAGYEQLLARDDEIIRKYVEIMDELETSDRLVIDRMTLTTRDRKKVYFDMKAAFPDVSHNELVELRMAARRISVRHMRGEEVGAYTRTVNRRRLKIEGNEVLIRVGKTWLPLEVGRVPFGELVSVRLGRHFLDFHLQRPMEGENVVGIDIGRVNCGVLLHNGEFRDGWLCDDDEVSKWVWQMGRQVGVPEGLVVKIGRLRGEKVISFARRGIRLYYELLRNPWVYGVYMVSEKNTSAKSHVCGKFGLRGGRLFYCENCDLKLHADLNAAINIGRQ